jgi:hypothetical protein
MEGVLAASAQFDNDVRSDRTRAGMRAALELGRWTFPAPLGYLNAPKWSKTSLIPDPERELLVRRAFEDLATGNYTEQEVIARATEAGLRSRKGLRLSPQSFGQMMRPKSANAEEQGKTLSGLHSKYVLALIDESGAIPTSVLRAAEQALSNCLFGKIVQAGNPISREGMLYAADTMLRHQWTVIRITGDPDDPRRSPRIDLEWATQQIATYGRDNPWVQSYILGLFPPQSLNTLLTVEEVNSAMQRHLREDSYSWSQRRLGVDVARFGDDRTVIFPRQGLAAFPPIVMRGVRTTDIAARVAKTIVEWGADAPDLLTLIDDTGHWGHGAVDNLWAAGYSVMPVVLSDPAIDPRYRNKRAECWLEMANWVRRGVALPPIPELVAELTEPTYTFVNGRFLLEDKDQVKRRLGRSPDLADALSLTFAIADQPAEVADSVRRRSVGKAVTDFDPFGGAFR